MILGEDSLEEACPGPATTEGLARDPDSIGTTPMALTVEMTRAFANEKSCVGAGDPVRCAFRLVAPRRQSARSGGRTVAASPEAATIGGRRRRGAGAGGAVRRRVEGATGLVARRGRTRRLRMRVAGALHVEQRRAERARPRRRLADVAARRTATAATEQQIAEATPREEPRSACTSDCS